jgi:HPt (histidine-containing phosphotransfer) domain-containing protein
MNFRGLAEQLEMEEGEFLEILELFLETSVTNLGQLQSAVEGKDTQSAVRAAHSIKGAAANLRLTAIFELAQRMEREARENRLEGAIGTIQAIRENLNRLDESLKRETQRPEDAMT